MKKNKGISKTEVFCLNKADEKNHSKTKKTAKKHHLLHRVDGKFKITKQQLRLIFIFLHIEKSRNL